MIDLRLGDCLEVMKTIEDNSIDAIITDPPYGTTACKWDSVIDFELMWEQLNRVIKPNGAIVLFGSEPFSSVLRMSNIKNYKYDWVWDKNKPTGMLNAKRQPLRRFENVMLFYKKQCTYNPQKTINPNSPEKRSLYAYSRENEGGETTGEIKQGGVSSNYEADKLLPVNIQVFKKPNKPKHPTQKPLLLMEYLIRTYTNEGETVLDFTMGSGTTMLACKNLNRNGIGIENDEGYFKIAQQRINKIDTEPKMF
jgi:site-specific DNA-methyltransferase (adenine-specific)